MRASSLFAIAIMFLSCSTGNTQKSLPTEGSVHTSSSNKESFNLLSATYENVVSGYNGARSTEYYFKVAIRTSKDLQFDSAWINNKRFPVFISKETTNVTNTAVTPRQGDTVVLRVSAFDVSGKHETVVAPIQYQGAALIRYRENAEINFFIVEKVNILTLPNRP